jgi:hypothetical protein
MMKRMIPWMLALMLCAGFSRAAALPQDENLIVRNTTPARAWITLYDPRGEHASTFNPRSIEPNGWFSHYRSRDGLSGLNGPWKLRLEADYKGKHFDQTTRFWYDGAQHNYNNHGDPNSVFYICEKSDAIFWSISPRCDRRDS